MIRDLRDIQYFLIGVMSIIVAEIAIFSSLYIAWRWGWL